MKSFCFFKNVVKRNSKEKLYNVPTYVARWEIFMEQKSRFRASFGLVGSTKNYNLAGNEQLLRVHFFHAFVGKNFFTNLVAFALKVRKF